MPTTFDAGGEGGLVVWVCDDPAVWRQGCDACIVLDVPRDLLEDDWAPLSAHPTAQDWGLPAHLADLYAVGAGAPMVDRPWPDCDVSVIEISSLMQSALDHSRPNLDEDRVAYLMFHPEKVEPIFVYFDGVDLIPADGHHRVEAARRSEQSTIRARLRPGTRQDALRFRSGDRLPWAVLVHRFRPGED